MKQYTDTSQTMRLKALGFPSPKSVSKLSLDIDMDTVPTFDYSIGELIEMLPKNGTRTKNIEFDGLEWFIDWDFDTSIYQTASSELIDALFDIIVKLKEEGKI